MRTADFDFPLPPESIAMRPAGKRDHSRLLVLHKDGRTEHKRFFDLKHYLNENDMLLMNDTKVFPARLRGTKPSGGKMDILLVRHNGNATEWEILRRGGFNGMVSFTGGLEADIWTEPGPGASDCNPVALSARPRSFLRFRDIDSSSVYDVLWRHGLMPLPPYIKRQPDRLDRERYQTVYAENQGSIAAPTAGMHFTADLLEALKRKGIRIAYLTLHVGVGTFKPVKAADVGEHAMNPEYFEIGPCLPEEIRAIKKAGGRLVTVGTTSTRAIEGFLSGAYQGEGPEAGDLSSGGRNRVPLRGHTNIFIYPGYEFKAADCLVTNFHLPRSTPLMLAAAFAGRKRILNAYKEALALGYRFFSYGDAMLIL